MKTIFSSPVSKAFWLFAKTLGSTVTAVVGAEIAKRAMQKLNGEDSNDKWQQKAEDQENRVHELEQQVKDLQERLDHVKTQAFSVPWPPQPPGHNPAETSPIIGEETPHFPKGEEF